MADHEPYKRYVNEWECRFCQLQWKFPAYLEDKNTPAPEQEPQAPFGYCAARTYRDLVHDTAQEAAENKRLYSTQRKAYKDEPLTEFAADIVEDLNFANTLARLGVGDMCARVLGAVFTELRAERRRREPLPDMIQVPGPVFVKRERELKSSEQQQRQQA